MAGLTASLSTFWRLKWWILAPTVVAAVVTSVASHYLLPTRYRSEATMIVLAPREADDDGGRRMVTAARFQQISQQITSRTFLEQIVRDLHLDDGSRGQSPVSEIIEHMRQDIGVQFVGVPSEATTVRVSFLAEDPQTAKTVTERLISFALDEHQHDSVMTAKRADEFIEAQIEDLRRRLIDVEQNLEQLGARRGGRPLSQADVLPYEVLQERYRTLLVRREESRTAATAGQRRIGEQLRILDLPQVPDEPHGPSRLQANSAGTFLGLGLGVALAGVRRRSCRLG